MIQTSNATRRSPLDHLLVKRIEHAQTQHGGIVTRDCMPDCMPDCMKDAPQEARVIAVGTGDVSDGGAKTTLDVKLGDRVLFDKDSGNEVRLGGRTYVLMREQDVLGIRAS